MDPLELFRTKLEEALVLIDSKVPAQADVDAKDAAWVSANDALTIADNELTTAKAAIAAIDVAIKAKALELQSLLEAFLTEPASFMRRNFVGQQT